MERYWPYFQTGKQQKERNISSQNSQDINAMLQKQKNNKRKTTLI